ncbi:hypothetical protein M758_9G113200 [Ceratodon purpureus]|nr:hypothetical protein M758_9G113200 [Ceratodon purpureus]
MIKPSRLPCEVALQIGAKVDVTQINGVLKGFCFDSSNLHGTVRNKLGAATLMSLNQMHFCVCVQL